MALGYFLACVVGLSSLVSAQPPTYGLLGQEVHLKPVITGHPDDILWKHDGNKVVEFNGKEEHVYSKYHSRVTLDWVSAELNITDLRHEDSGEYELEIYVNKGMHRFAYNLEVIDKVNKPSVSCDTNSSSSDTRGTWATLTCSAEPTQPPSSLKYENVYEWESSGKVQTGPQLTVLLEDEPDDQIYTCTVRNPLTSETTTFATTSCSPDTSSTVALAIGLTIIFLVIFIVLLGVVFCKLKNKACFAKDDVENRRSPTEDQNDERTHFLHGASTLPSQQRLRPLVPAHSDEANGLPADNHRGQAAADLDKAEESNKEEDEIEHRRKTIFGVTLKPIPSKCALQGPDHQVESKCRHESESEGQLVSSAAEEEDDKGKTEEDRPPTSPEQNMPNTASGEHHPKLSEGETQAKEDDQPEMNKTVSGDKSESDGEETEILREDTSQSPTPKNIFGAKLKPTALKRALPNPDPKLEGKSRHESEGEGQSDSSAAEEVDDEGKTEEDQPPISPEQNMPETAPGEHHPKMSEGETQAKEDDQQEMNKTVSGDKRDSDGEETEDNLYTDTSQSPTPRNTDNTQTNTFEKSPNAKIPDPDPKLEGESRHESEGEGQSDSSAAEEEDDEGKTEEDRPPTSPEQNMPNTASGEHHPKLSEGETQAKEDDQPEMNKTVSGDKRESDGEETEILREDTSQSPTPENTDNTQTNTFEKSPNAKIPDSNPKLEGESRHESEGEGQSDSSAAEEVDDEGKTEEDQPSTSTEQNMPNTASGEHHSKLSEEEPQAKEDDQPEMNKTVSGDKRDSDGEETEIPREDTSQSPTPNNTDNTQNNTFEKSLNAKIPDPDPKLEGESKHESEDEGHSDSSAAEEEDDEGQTEEKTKAECDSKEEKPGNMRESEDKEGGK